MGGQRKSSGHRLLGAQAAEAAAWREGAGRGRPLTRLALARGGVSCAGRDGASDR